MNHRSRLLPFILLFFYNAVYAQDPLITNMQGRASHSLNGKWQYIIDPYETGFYNYRWTERNINDREAYWSSDVAANKTERKEHGYSDKYTLDVPGDWNSQSERLLYYEGTVWYKKSFDISALPNGKAYLYFGAVNYKADVYLNGIKLGTHKGGFTPFNFLIPQDLLKSRDNFLVVKVDNKRSADEIPTLNTDWWNYGGITRDVKLVFVPDNFILDYNIQLARKPNVIKGWIKLNAPGESKAEIEIPELKLKHNIKVIGDSAAFSFAVKNLQAWSPENPKLYDVIVRTSKERLEDKIGFRTIEVVGQKILLNGKPIFLRGICTHEEMPEGPRRATSRQDAEKIFKQAVELNANMVRLAHYPHNENMVRVADSMGILLWSEIPVYWTIQFSNKEVLQKAQQQLTEMVTRDRNRASIIIWSVGNETPVSPIRNEFMKALAVTAKALDSTRLISAALEQRNVNGINTVDDPLGNYTDIISVNEYIGWYGAGLPDVARNAKWEIKFDKPFFISETGAEALGGLHADSLTMWSEEYQEWYYKEQIAMMKRMPSNFTGIAPWILNDFRSPRRANPVYQEGWNNKGLYDQKGRKKKAFYILKAYYDEMEGRGGR